MRGLDRRALFQIAVLAGVALMVFFLSGCWGCGICGCSSGSDHSSTAGSNFAPQSQSSETAAGVVERYHDFGASSAIVTTKDLQYLRTLAAGQWAIGLLAPTAAGAPGPGQLLPDGHEIRFDAGPALQILVSLIPDAETAAGLASLFPPPAGAQWQALKPADADWVNSIPTQTITITNSFGQLHYFVDFQSESLCNGCAMQMSACTTQPVPLTARLALQSMTDLRLKSGDDGLTCIEPKPSIVTVVGHGGQLLPGRLIAAAFGFWGGPAITTTITSTVNIPLRLEHTSPATETFRLEPIQSELGFSYAWRDMGNQAIAEITLPPAAFAWGPLNLQARAGDLPTCVHLLDTVYVTATHVTTPTLQATNWINVQLLPDPARCPIADVGLRKTTSAASVNAGDWLTYTLTITNYENRALNAVVTDVLSPAYAADEWRLPAGCEPKGAAIRCTLSSLSARSARSLALGVKIAPTFAGSLENRAHVEPARALDTRQYDNDADAPAVDVRRLRWPAYLPLVRKE